MLLRWSQCFSTSNWGQEILFSVSEKSGKSQGILFPKISGNPDVVGQTPASTIQYYLKCLNAIDSIVNVNFMELWNS